MTWKTYSKYRDSGVPWLGQIPKKWEMKRLKYCAPVFNKKTNGAMDGLPYIGLEHIESWTGRLLPNEVEVETEGQSNSFKAGDVLFGKLRPYLAKVVSAKNEGICSGELLVLRPKEIDQDYLFYYMVTRDFVSIVDSSTYGAKMPRANWEFIGHLPFLIPSEHEQKAIAVFLDRETGKIDLLIEKKERQIELLKEKRSALISHAVTKGLDPNAKMKDSGIPWLGQIPEHWVAANLRWYIGIASGEGLASNEIEGYEDAVKKYCVIGGNGTMGYSEHVNTTSKSFAIGRVGALCGNVHLIEENCWITDNALKISSWRSFHDEFLFHLLCAANLNEYANKSAQPLITGDQVKSLRVPMPPSDEQVRIADYVELETTNIDGLIDKVQESIDKLRDYRTALISAAVTGKIDVREEVA